MEYPVLYSFIFALVFFGLPVLVYMRVNRIKGVGDKWTKRVRVDWKLILSKSLLDAHTSIMNRENIESALEEFNKRYPRPGIEPIAIKGEYDLVADWPNTYPNVK